MARNIRIFSPLDGKLIPLKKCPYPIFASGAIGRGVAIKNPTYGVFAPFSGIVTLFFPIGHAIGLKSNDGIEIFIHIGIDDDEMNCAEFKSELKVGETIKPGQLLLNFSPMAIEKAVFDSTAVVIVTNHAEYGDITFDLGGQSITVKAADSVRKNNLSKEKGKMEETKFTILGESLSGKTCYLLAMYSEMSQSINGYSIVAQDDRLDTELLESFEKLDDDSISNERFPGATDQTVTYLFNLNYANKPIMPFKWIDYPGRIMRDKTDGDYPKVAQNIRESSTLFICVDGELLVGDNTARKIKNVK
ncbi:MAG: PTS glucose transporter subunit IIA, partial [Selenomonadaceae bacterium]|nr:PTS glucose transporter subunit IIA [Selenomonadaceae bacterium]